MLKIISLPLRLQIQEKEMIIGSYAICYDANGNILTMDRNGIAPNLQMDKLKYKYENVANGFVKNTNKLRYVEDIASTYGTDIDNQAPNNYEYDAIGNLTKDKAEKINDIMWSISGKPLNIVKGSADYGNTSEIEYRYDAQGNRVTKIIKPLYLVTAPEAWQYTFYVRDASGNVMATYERTDTDYKLADHTIYGSSRLGLQQRNLPIVGVANPSSYKLYLNQKYYELSDHRGNVNTTISDFRIGVGTTTNPNLLDHYAALIRTTADYGVWGDELVGRGESMMDFRYGFNGKEKDGEIKGDGNSYDFGARIYDPRVGKFLSLDPLAKRFASESNYSYAGNSPIFLIDKDGKKKVWYVTVILENGKVISFKIINESKVKEKVVGQTHIGYFDERVHEVYHDWDTKQDVTIDFSKKSIVYGEERETGPTPKWYEIFTEGSGSLQRDGLMFTIKDAKLGTKMIGKIPVEERDITDLLIYFDKGTHFGPNGLPKLDVKELHEATDVITDIIDEAIPIIENISSKNRPLKSYPTQEQYKVPSHTGNEYGHYLNEDSSLYEKRVYDKNSKTPKSVDTINTSKSKWKN